MRLIVCSREIPPDRGGGHRPRGGFEPLGLDGVAHLLAVPSLGDNPASSRTASREKQPLSPEQLPSCVVTLCGDPDPHEGLPPAPVAGQYRR
jgi:hypothetical protein